MWLYPEAALLCDLHAHVAFTEVIGFLGGYWDGDSRVLHIKEAWPCRAIASVDDANVNVEMDPVSQLEVLGSIAKAGQTPLGWYHSHPVFVPDPSVRDMENQYHMQTQFAHFDDQPFVGKQAVQVAPGRTGWQLQLQGPPRTLPSAAPPIAWSLAQVERTLRP